MTINVALGFGVLSMRDSRCLMCSYSSLSQRLLEKWGSKVSLKPRKSHLGCYTQVDDARGMA
jgi:hypothetical protein